MNVVRASILLAALVGAPASIAASQYAGAGPAAASPESATTAGPPSPVEQRWGIRLLGIRLSAAGYMMDFRYYITDPLKAAPLFTRGLQPVLEDESSGAKFIVPAPPKTGPLRSTNTPQAGRTYFMFFANPAKYVKPGRLVTIAIGDFRAEHLRVMAESDPFPEMPRFDARSVTVRHPVPPAASAGDDKPGADLGRARPATVAVPDLTLTDQDGAQVTTGELLEGRTPVIVTFMYTACETKCPTMAATLAQVQRDLGAQAAGASIVSVAIDPARDSPERMREFLAKYDARPGWRFVTGTIQESEQLQRAFDVYRGGLASHPPAYFIRDARSGSWWRIGGLPAPEVVAGELLRLAGQDKEPE